MAEFMNLVGHTVGRLTIESRAENDQYGRARWNCRCMCGVVVVVNAGNLRRGGTTSCGCAKLDMLRARAKVRAPKPPRPATHGMFGTPTYASWQSMLARCRNPRVRCWKNYGGRGITACERWLGDEGFANFLADMGERPEGTTLDRKDANGNYEPGNCRWATAAEQGQNKRTNTFEVHEPQQVRWLVGLGYTQAEVARFFGAHVVTVSDIVRGKTWKEGPWVQS